MNITTSTIQGKPSTSSMRSGTAIPPSRIPQPSRGSQEHLRRVYRSNSLAQLGRGAPAPTLEESEQSDTPNQQNIAHEARPFHTSSSNLPNTSNASNIISANHEVPTMPSNENQQSRFSTNTSSSMDRNARYPVDDTTVEPTHSSDDQTIGAFSRQHSPRAVRVDHEREGAHERLEDIELVSGENAKVTGDSVSLSSTPVRTWSVMVIRARSPPPPTKSLKKKVLEFLCCDGM
ncbi:MAG: hypothetical protein M1821_005768 [Bathelium mastoideum]|nr:MAG: hypothetical protein M1821_005768 [Bathelium mastoideum]